MELSTEEKIRVASRTVFHNKGYSAIKTKDIAQEAGINLALFFIIWALLNYRKTS